MRYSIYDDVKCSDTDYTFQDDKRNECTILKDTCFKNKYGRRIPCTFKKPRKKEKDR